MLAVPVKGAYKDTQTYTTFRLNKIGRIVKPL